MVEIKPLPPQDKQFLSLPLRSAASRQTLLSLGILKLEVNRPDPCPAGADIQAEDQILAMQGKSWKTHRRGSSQLTAVREGSLGVVTQEFTMKYEGVYWPRREWTGKAGR